MMQESDACWLYMGREVMDTERLWCWEVRGRFASALPVVNEAAEPVSAWESETELDINGVSGEESAVGEQVEKEEARVVLEDEEEAELEQEEQARLSCMMQEL